MEYSARERAEAYRYVFGRDGKRNRHQEIVYHELCGKWKFYSCFQMVPGVGVDTVLAAQNSGKVQVAEAIHNNLTVPLRDIEGDNVEVTKKPSESKEKDHVDE